jgi:DNA-binding response OmpR family regulator
MQENQADIIISDIKIKGLVNGTQVCDELHLKYKTPIIFLSAYDNDDFLINAQKSDPIGYLIKPFREDELEALLKLASLKVVQKNRSFIKKDGFVFDIENNKLYKNDIEIKLTSNENDLLSFVIDASPNIVGYKSIIEQIWYNSQKSDDELKTRIRTMLRNIRKKTSETYITTIVGEGLKFEI